MTFEVTFTMRNGSYHRTVNMFGVPRIGETVQIDDVGGKVVNVIWNINGAPNGRSVTVICEKWSVL